MAKASKNKRNGAKKNRIRKHVLKPQGTETTSIAATTCRDDDDYAESTNIDKTANEDDNPSSPSSSKNLTKKRKNDARVKDPEEALAYLTRWKARRTAYSTSTSRGWKFNKNTQCWLIRHMYEVDKVPKGTFDLLLEYLQGLEGEATKKRIRIEASRRAVRYKNHCINGGSIDNSVVETESRNEDKDEANNTTSDHDDKKNTKTIETKAAATTNTNISSNDDLENDLARWKKLDEGDKRKEYKRARKILLMKE